MSKRVNLDLGLQQMLNGPWLVVQDDGDIEVVLKEEELGDGWRTVIAECSQEQMEIAHLISAAPELLKALQTCAAVCAGETMHKDGLIEALELARAAITKAKGGAP